MRKIGGVLGLSLLTSIQAFAFSFGVVPDGGVLPPSIFEISTARTLSPIAAFEPLNRQDLTAAALRNGFVLKLQPEVKLRLVGNILETVTDGDYDIRLMKKQSPDDDFFISGSRHYSYIKNTEIGASVERQYRKGKASASSVDAIRKSEPSSGGVYFIESGKYVLLFNVLIEADGTAYLRGVLL
jgi:hypothetical protein